MFFFFDYSKLDVFGDVLSGLEDWCIAFNNFAVTLFLYLKYIFAFTLISLGIFTIFDLRDMHKKRVIKWSYTTNSSQKKDETKDLEEIRPNKRIRFVLGSFYITMGLGIIFNFAVYFLIFCLDWLPDRFIFDFINFSGRIDPNYINRIEDVEKAKYPHEKTIYYCVAIASFGAILDVVLSIAYILNKSEVNHRKTTCQLIGGIIIGMLVGWTTCLPLFL